MGNIRTTRTGTVLKWDGSYGQVYVHYFGVVDISAGLIDPDQEVFIRAGCEVDLDFERDDFNGRDSVVRNSVRVK